MYDYAQTRAGTNTGKFLEGYHGYLVADWYDGYNGVKAERCGCWAHLRRRFKEAIPDTDAGPFTVGRKNWLFSAPPKGAKSSATVYSIIESAKANATSGVVATFTIVLYGDVNGDGIISAVDSDDCVLVQNWMIEWDEKEDAAFIKAADVNGDGRVDAIDADVITAHINWIITIDQATGLAS